MVMDYKEQIKSPKWQKRRLEIMQKDNFTCQLCGDTESMLNHDDCIYNLVGPDSAMGQENDIKLLYERRKALKKPYFDNIKKERETKNKDNPF